MTSKNTHILLAHGSGGRLSHELVREVFLPYFSNPLLDKLDDQAVVEPVAGRLAFTTDSYVVDPLFFPGGDIGRLSVCGTVNDLAMSGAKPLYLSASFVLEEGFPLEDLRKILASMEAAAEEANITVITGDTKVVNRGKADKVFITTSGVGVIPPGVNISGHNARPGDKILLSGSLGDHGMAVLCQREGIALQSAITSDAAPLNSLVEAMLAASPEIHALRDPTRGGLATTLNEIAQQSGISITISEDDLPVKEEVRGACEILGLDPLYVANEGKLVAVIAPAALPKVLKAMWNHPLGREACLLGEVKASPAGQVVMKTRIGGTRLVDMLSGEQLPRIC